MLKKGVSYLEALISENNNDKKCFICKNKCFFKKYFFYEIFTKKDTNNIFLSNKYYKKKFEEVLCNSCKTCIVQCEMCDDKFLYSSVEEAYSDPKLKHNITVCLLCFSYEACSQCKYLGGSSPCRWCRFI